MRRVLLTRPREDAEPLAARLAAMGIESRIDPLLAIVPVQGAAADLSGVQALLFTSANGVRAFTALSPERGLPAFAVGDQTARALSEAGFSSVQSAAGDVEDLAHLVKHRLDPAQGALLHAAGSKVAGDLAGRLGDAGFTVRRAVLYESRAAEALDAATVQELNEGAFEAALFYSPRTAATFARLAAMAGVVPALERMDALCLSRAVADTLSGIAWRRLRVAERPEQESLLALLGPDRPAGGTMTENAKPDLPSPADDVPAVVATKRAVGIYLTGALVALLAIAGAGYALWPMAERSLLEQVHQNDNDVHHEELVGFDMRIKALEMSVSKLSARLEAMERAPAAVAAPAAPSPAAAPSQEGEEKIARLNQRIEVLERALNDVANRKDSGPALLLATGQMRDALLSGRPFLAELRSVAALSAGEAALAQALDALAPEAEKGVPALPALKRRFDELKPELRRALRPAAAGDWKQAALDKVTSLVTVRRVGSEALADPGPLGALARAEAALAKDDLAGAVAALGLIAADAVLAPWLEDAKRRLEAEKRLAEMSARALALSAVK
jgi:uroporphyrinogen-III synthase